MALDVTHLRFALDVRDDYDVADLSRYLSGAIYPDTRYATGIDRALTHPKDFDEIPLPKEDDFRKGWETHLIYDAVQSELFASITGTPTDSVRQYDKEWLRRTTFKILQMESDLRLFDTSDVAERLRVILTPFGESETVVRDAFAHVVDFLRERPEGVRALPLFRMKQGGDSRMREIAEDLQERCDAIRKDPELMRRIAGMYDETMRMYHERYR